MINSVNPRYIHLDQYLQQLGDFFAVRCKIDRG